MGFFDNNQQFSGSSSYSMGLGPEENGYTGSLNWGDPRNTSTDVYALQPGAQSNEQLQALIKAWAQSNGKDLSHLGAFQGDPYDTEKYSTLGQFDQARYQADMDALNAYAKENFGDFVLGKTRISGSDSDGGAWRTDLLQRTADGYRPINGATSLSGDTGYKSDGRLVGAIIASWAGGHLLAGGSFGAAGAAGAEGGAAAGAAGGGTTGVTGANGAFLGEGVASGVPAWDSSYVAAGGTLGGGAAGNEGVLDWSAERPPATGDGAGAEGIGGGDGWSALDDYYTGNGGADGSISGPGTSSGAGAQPGSTSTYQPEYNFDPNGLPEGSPYASDFAGAGGGTPAAGAGAAGGSGSSWIPAASQAINALIATRQSDKARDALLQGGAEANATQRYMFDTLNALQAPYRTTAYRGLDNLNGLMRDPSSVTRDPGYEWQRQQGQQGIERSAAARGLGLSGAALKQASRYNTDYATTKYNDVWNRNLAAAGLGQVSNGQTNQFGTNYANNVSNTQMGMGNALAANYLNQGNIYSNALNGISAYYSRPGG